MTTTRTPGRNSASVSIRKARSQVTTRTRTRWHIGSHWSGLLIAGIVMAFLASKYNSKLMDNAQMAVAVWAPDKDSPEWQEKEWLLRWVNF